MGVRCWLRLVRRRGLLPSDHLEGAAYIYLLSWPLEDLI